MIILWLLSWTDKGDKTYLIAAEARNVPWPICAVLRKMFCFLTDQTKVQILDYGQTTHKGNVSGTLFQWSPTQKGKKDTWLQVRTNPTLFVNTHYWCYLPWKQPNFHFNRLSEVASRIKTDVECFHEDIYRIGRVIM